ncbi:MAG: hypothetical protein RI897_4103 [Verrucomicrobiota bacterium]|jgi:hypothetical protein
MGEAFVSFEGDGGGFRGGGVGEGLGIIAEEEGEGLEGGFQRGEDSWRWGLHGWRFGGFGMRLCFGLRFVAGIEQEWRLGCNPRRLGASLDGGGWVAMWR